MKRDEKGEEKEKEGLQFKGKEGGDKGELHRWYHQWPRLSSASRRPSKACTTTQAKQRLRLVPETKATK